MQVIRAPESEKSASEIQVTRATRVQNQGFRDTGTVNMSTKIRNSTSEKEVIRATRVWKQDLRDEGNQGNIS